jgi:hypothetical protein
VPGGAYVLPYSRRRVAGAQATDHACQKDKIKHNSRKFRPHDDSLHVSTDIMTRNCALISIKMPRCSQGGRYASAQNNGSLASRVVEYYAAKHLDRRDQRGDRNVPDGNAPAGQPQRPQN